MSSADDDRTAGGERSSASADAQAGADPLRDLLLGLAAQIDQVASWFATSGHPAASGDVGQLLTGVFARDGRGADIAGEFTSLIREGGDLLARLITALIAVLETVAEALRSGPATTSPPARHYQQIEVRLDVSGDPDAAAAAPPQAATPPKGQM